MTRKVGLIVIVIGFLFLANAIRHEVQGSVTISYRGYPSHTFRKATSPLEFRQAMGWFWLRSALPIFAGYFLIQLIRKQESMDPFSPEFKGQESIDELGRFLDEKAKAQKTAEARKAMSSTGSE